MDNPWNIQSIYELQFFNCPSCIYKDHSKQEFINHAFKVHPESVEYLENIDDKSLTNIVVPWSEQNQFKDESINFLEVDVDPSNIELPNDIKTEDYDTIQGAKVISGNFEI